MRARVRPRWQGTGKTCGVSSTQPSRPSVGKEEWADGEGRVPGASSHRTQTEGHGSCLQLRGVSTRGRQAQDWELMSQRPTDTWPPWQHSQPHVGGGMRAPGQACTDPHKCPRPPAGQCPTHSTCSKLDSEWHPLPGSPGGPLGVQGLLVTSPVRGWCLTVAMKGQLTCHLHLRAQALLRLAGRDGT